MLVDVQLLDAAVAPQTGRIRAGSWLLALLLGLGHGQNRERRGGSHGVAGWDSQVAATSEQWRRDAEEVAVHLLRLLLGLGAFVHRRVVVGGLGARGVLERGQAVGVERRHRERPHLELLLLGRKRARHLG